MTTPAPLRAALIGCGHISVRHIPGWQATPDAELVAVCDQDRARAEERARRFGIPRVYTDVANLLAQEPLDCVDIATRPETHRALVEQAAERGVHVLCQKPIAATLAEGRAMASACDRAGARFMVMEMWRHLPSFRALRRYLERGLIGRPHALRILGQRRPLNRAHPVDEGQPYFAEMPKLLIYEMGIHWIDAARYLLGPIDTVYAQTARVNPAIVGEDVALIVMSHVAEATTTIDASWASPAEGRALMRDGDVLLEGLDGSLRLDPYAGELRHVTVDGVTVLERYGAPDRAYQAAFDGCIGDFAGALRWDRPFESPARDNLATLAVTLAAYDSASSGEAARPEPAAGSSGIRLGPRRHYFDVFVTPSERERLTRLLDELLDALPGLENERLHWSELHGASDDDEDAYDDLMDELAGVGESIDYLQDLLGEAKRIDEEEARRADYARPGSWIRVRRESGEETTYHVHWPACDHGWQDWRTRTPEGYVTHRSPIATALIGTRAGERTTVVGNAGDRWTLEVLAVDQTAPPQTPSRR